jgi:hypothetical protein
MQRRTKKFTNILKRKARDLEIKVAWWKKRLLRYNSLDIAKFEFSRQELTGFLLVF